MTPGCTRARGQAASPRFSIHCARTSARAQDATGSQAQLTYACSCSRRRRVSISSDALPAQHTLPLERTAAGSALLPRTCLARSTLAPVRCVSTGSGKRSRTLVARRAEPVGNDEPSVLRGPLGCRILQNQTCSMHDARICRGCARLRSESSSEAGVQTNVRYLRAAQSQSVTPWRLCCKISACAPRRGSDGEGCSLTELAGATSFLNRQKARATNGVA